MEYACRPLINSNFAIYAVLPLIKSPAMFWTSLHKDITYRLEKQNHTLYDEVQKVLRVNKEERHLRGGAATRQKYHPEIE